MGIQHTAKPRTSTSFLLFTYNVSHYNPIWVNGCVIQNERLYLWYRPCFVNVHMYHRHVVKYIEMHLNRNIITFEGVDRNRNTNTLNANVFKYKHKYMGKYF